MLVRIAKLYTPEYIKIKQLDELFRLTADAFRCECPDLKGFNFSERMTKYAEFTANQADRFLQGKEPLTEVKGRLYQNAYRMGRSLRKSLHVRTWKQAIEVMETVYRIMGIDFQYSRDQFIIKECYFSSHYSAEVCDFISSLDEGMAAGLSDGARLKFHQRITEGCDCCRGVFR